MTLTVVFLAFVAIVLAIRHLGKPAAQALRDEVKMNVEGVTFVLRASRAILLAMGVLLVVMTAVLIISVLARLFGAV